MNRIVACRASYCSRRPHNASPIPVINLIASAAIIVAAALLSACVSNPNQVKTAEILPATDDLPSVAKLPLRAGVYYSREFAHDKRSRTVAGQTDIVPIGEASRIMFDGGLSQGVAQTPQGARRDPFMRAFAARPAAGAGGGCGQGRKEGRQAVWPDGLGDAAAREAVAAADQGELGRAGGELDAG